ncbi:D-alanyl-D-alanine carboxypeptidase/D-alanyl-D-alanine-endopeptidase [Hymenobacter chitinivorans]|uniref:D-alanyl-D-alanine carboxypeptidase/D-alanyl-D-alanine-endopeptidase (Penicillin-binding protein 4) n=1 Tax=Hymenobacter chitinivorans DSM 11115 TaxID=1121954 RepID=A0A2M9AQT2_9BACT|nr:D-alanyl-D-alanine carboxypeptidase [Hymenobacter chitinivorans]PJJ48057.1 D-alanyl-D-alanine carboxypeptidase/D-alanyl-D-alanine-endopeptidase (penicillin-binding protein 4) [Hymenobacter chitinivorans DSM 11115]
MSRLLLLSLLLCALLTGPAARAQNRAAATGTETALQRGQGPRWLNRLVTGSAVLRQHHTGLSITDVATGEVVYELNSAEYFQPASTMKLFSLYAGLHLLGDSLPSLRYVVRADSLIFWGTGDPTLLHGDVPSRRAFTFLQSRPEKLFYTAIPTVEAFGPGWSWDDYNYYFSPERSPFPIYGNVVRFRAAPGQPARVAPRLFAPLVTPAPPGATSPDHVRRPLLENRFVVYPAAQSWTDETPFRTSPELVLKLLQDTLRRPVLALPWRPQPPQGIRTLPGLPVDSLYRRMLQVSDNFLAEQLLLMCASRLGADSLNTARVIKAVRQQWLADLPDAPRWVDGSGLSRLNLATPRDLTALLLKLHREVPEARLLSLLAAGGGHGSLRRGYHDARGPWFWGKTGTLTNVHNLSGYLRTRKGRLLAVSFMNNNHVAETSAVRREMELILTQVRERL